MYRWFFQANYYPEKAVKEFCDDRPFGGMAKKLLYNTNSNYFHSCLGVPRYILLNKVTDKVVHAAGTDPELKAYCDITRNRTIFEIQLF